MKKLVTAMLTLSMLGPINTTASEDIEIVLNGTEMTFEQKPFIDDGTTLVPMRAIFEALDSTVEWDGETRSITSVKDDITITMQIDSYEMSVNDTILTLEKAPIIVDDFTFVPLRAVAESFNAEVNWDGEKRLITIDTPQVETATSAPAEEPTEAPTPTPFPTTDEEFAKMYEGTEYEFVRNLPKLTNDFTDGPGNIEEGQHHSWGLDYNGNGVMYIQKRTRKQETVTEVDMTLDVLHSHYDGEFIDISFDVYCPPVNGTSKITIMGSGESEILSISTRKYGEICKVSGGIEGSDLELNANVYFNNNTAGEESNIIIENGAHINILLDPNYAKAKIKISNNSNDSEVIEIIKFVGNLSQFDPAEKRILGYRFTAQHFGDAKPMIVDNIITNIVKVAE